MKLIIAGSRTVTDMNLLVEAVKRFQIKDVEAVLCGEAAGADQLGKQWAKWNNIEVLSYPADWAKYKKAAAYRRNIKMAQDTDAALIIRRNNSKGSSHMLNVMKKYPDKPVYLVDVTVRFIKDQ